MPNNRLIQFCALCFSAGLLAQELPTFDAYSVAADENARLAQIDFSALENADAFATRLQDYSGELANIGGHYFLAEMGCGTSCQTGLLINLHTGKPIAQATYSLGSCYQTDSRLLILNPYVDDNYSEQVPDWLYTYYYLIEDDTLTLLEKTRQSCGGECVSGQ